MLLAENVLSNFSSLKENWLKLHTKCLQLFLQTYCLNFQTKN